MIKTTPFTFKDSGVSVNIRKVSPLLAQRVSQSFPAPTPPIQEVDYGDGEKRKEPNLSHPDYIKALQQYNIDYEAKIRKVIIERGVDIVISEEIQAEINEFRQYMLDEMKIDLSAESDKVVYITYIACASQEDLDRMIGEILSSSQPTEEKVNDAIKSFPAGDEQS